MATEIKRDTFVFYRSFFEAIKDLDPKDQAILFCAVCELALNGVEVELKGINKTIFKLIKPQIEANNQKFINGRKGGAPKGNKNAQKQPKNNQQTTKNKLMSNEECIMSNEKCVMSNDIYTKTPYQKIINLYNEICTNLPKVMKLTESRKKSINARFKEYDENIKIFETLFNKANDSDFLCGNKSDWKANFDWLMNQQNMAKVLEDRYINSNSKEKDISYDDYKEKQRKLLEEYPTIGEADGIHTFEMGGNDNEKNE